MEVLLSWEMRTEAGPTAHIRNWLNEVGYLNPKVFIKEVGRLKFRNFPLFSLSSPFDSQRPLMLSHSLMTAQISRGASLFVTESVQRYSKQQYCAKGGVYSIGLCQKCHGAARTRLPLSPTRQCAWAARF